MDSDSDSSDSSHNSDSSKDLLFDFNVQQASTAEKNQPRPEPGSGSDSDSSGLSLKSDRSKGHPLDFNDQRASAAESNGNQSTPHTGPGPETSTAVEIPVSVGGMFEPTYGQVLQTNSEEDIMQGLVIPPMSQGNQETPHSTGPEGEPSSVEDEGEEDFYLNLTFSLNTTDEDKECQILKRFEDFCRLWNELAMQKRSARKRELQIKLADQERRLRSSNLKDQKKGRRLRRKKAEKKERRLRSSNERRYLCPPPTQILPPPSLFSHHQFPQPRRGLSSGQLDTSNLVGPGLDDEQICIDSATEGFIRLEGDLDRREELEASMETFPYPIVEVCNEDPDLENAEVLDLNDYEVFESDELDDC